MLQASSRFGLAVGMGLLFIAASPLGGTAAQGNATGTLTGQVMLCRMWPRPLEQAVDELNPRIVASPGGDRQLPRPVSVSAADVQLSIAGTNLSTRTDAGGQFTMAGVPAAEPLTLVADVPPGAPLVLNLPDLEVGPGETRDLGTLSLAGCARGVAAFVPTDPTPVPGQTAPDATASSNQIAPGPARSIGARVQVGDVSSTDGLAGDAPSAAQPVGGGVAPTDDEPPSSAD